MKYVLGFLFDINDDTVLLVRKNRPSWQNGLLNGIGGKIEPGETPLEAMVREFKEETGLGGYEWDNFLTMKFSGEEKSKMYCFKATTSNVKDCKSENDVGEFIFSVPVKDIYYRADKMKNLQWMIPLAWHEPFGSKVKYKEKLDA